MMQKPKITRQSQWRMRLKKFGWISALIVGGEEVDVNFARATANYATH